MQVRDLIKVLSGLNQDSVVRVKVSDVFDGCYELLDTIRATQHSRSYFLVNNADKTFINLNDFPIVYSINEFTGE